MQSGFPVVVQRCAKHVLTRRERTRNRDARAVRKASPSMTSQPDCTSVLEGLSWVSRRDHAHARATSHSRTRPGGTFEVLARSSIAVSGFNMTCFSIDKPRSKPLRFVRRCCCRLAHPCQSTGRAVPARAQSARDARTHNAREVRFAIKNQLLRTPKSTQTLIGVVAGAWRRISRL
jgi:hypothetical protein